MSPRYPDLYPNQLKCGYNISSPASSSVTIIFDVFDIEYGQDCKYDFISVSYATAQSPLINAAEYDNSY